MNPNTRYVVFFDSNALRDKDYIKPDLKSHIDKVKEHKFINTKLYLPEVVKKEWIYQYSIRVKKYYQDLINTIQKLSGMKAPSALGDSVNESDPEELGEQYLAGLGFLSHPTPPDLSVDDILHRAINHLFPFEESSDKGVKDMVICKTIHDYYKDHLESDTTMVVISHDNKFKQYLSELIVESTNFEILDSLSEFVNRIELEANDLNANYGPKAAELFSAGSPISSLMETESIGAKLEHMYEERIPNASAGIKYFDSLPEKYKNFNVPTLGSGSSWSYKFKINKVGDTTFIKKARAILHWETIVKLPVHYVRDDSNASILMSVLNVTSLIHEITFKVTWTAKADQGGLIQPKIIAINFSHETLNKDDYFSIFNDTYPWADKGFLYGSNLGFENLAETYAAHLAPITEASEKVAVAKERLLSAQSLISNQTRSVKKFNHFWDD